MEDFSQLNRRALLRQAILAAGAASFLTINGAVLAATATPTALTPSAFALLQAVADTIIPRTDTAGAIDAGVPALFDGLLVNWASPARKAQLIEALSSIDTAARRAVGMGFLSLPLAKREEVLASYDELALSPAPVADMAASDPGGQPKVNSVTSLMNAAPVANPEYAKLKELIVILYYYSEPALTQELTYEQVPGAWEPSLPLTPATRQTGGAGAA